MCMIKINKNTINSWPPFLLFWTTNMAAVTSCENVQLVWTVENV